jgi:hypothetical protein
VLLAAAPIPPSGTPVLGLPAADPAATPEPARLAAALDAAGAPLARPTFNSSRKATQAQRAHKKRVKRIKLFAVLVFLAVAALAGPPLVRWAIDQAGGGSEPLAPDAPTEVTVPVADAG